MWRAALERILGAALLIAVLLTVIGVGAHSPVIQGVLTASGSPAPPTPVGSDSYVTFPATTAGNDGTVEALDSMNGQVLGSALTVGVNPGAIAVDTAASEVVVANSGDGVHSDTTASVISTSGSSAWTVTSTVTGLPTGSKPAAAMDVPKSLALVVDNAADDVSVVSMAGTPALVGNLSLGVSGGQPSSIATSPDGMYAYVTIPNKSDVVVLHYNGNAANDDFTISTTYNTTSFTPVAIAESADGDFAYVTNTSTDVIDKFDDSPTKWSLSSSTISLSAAPGAIVAAPNGNLYVSIPSASKIAVVNTTAGASPSVTYYSRSSTPGPLALNADSSVLDVASSSTSAVELVNAATGGTVETASSLPNTPSAIATYPSGQTRFFAYVANSGSGTVSVIDTVTDSVVTTLTVGSNPEAIAVAPDNSAVYVANYGSNTVSVIEPADILSTTNPVVATVSMASGSEPDALALTPSGTALLVAEYAKGQVEIVDTNPADTTNYLHVLNASSPIYLNGSGQSSTQEPLAIAFAPSGQYAYVTDNGAAAVSVLQQSSSAAGGYSYGTQQSPSGLSAPSGIAVSPNGTTAYVSNSTSSGTLYAFALASGTGHLGTDSTEAVGSDPSAVALSPSGTTAYVTNPGSTGSVSVVPLSPFGLATSESASAASGAAVAPDGGVYLVANDSSSGTVSVFGSGTIPLATVSVGSDPSAVAFGGNFSSPGTVVTPSASELQGGGANPSEGWQATGQGVQRISSSTAFSDGVDTATGAYSLHIEDFDIPDIGPSLDLSQTYDSAAASTSGPLGDSYVKQALVRDVVAGAWPLL